MVLKILSLPFTVVILLTLLVRTVSISGLNNHYKNFKYSKISHLQIFLLLKRRIVEIHDWWQLTIGTLTNKM